jgi:hypothetical protein
MGVATAVSPIAAAGSVRRFMGGGMTSIDGASASAIWTRRPFGLALGVCPPEQLAPTHRAKAVTGLPAD